VISCIGSKTPKVLKVGVYINYRFQRTHVERSSTAGKSTPGESVGGKFEISKCRRAKMIHSHLSMGGHLSTDQDSG
jgi:hypothetical protein